MEKMVDIPCSYSMTHLNIGKILANKEKIMETVKSAVPMISIIMAKKWREMMEEMEKLLKVCGYRISNSLMLIEEKVENFLEDLKHSEESECVSFFINSGLKPVFTT